MTGLSCCQASSSYCCAHAGGVTKSVARMALRNVRFTAVRQHRVAIRASKWPTFVPLPPDERSELGLAGRPYNVTTC